MTSIIAHRGASSRARENTVAAFVRAGEVGADGVELDVRRTGDGVLVVHHDPHLGDGRVICRLAGADLPAHVPTLAEALDACAGMFVNLEIKNSQREPDHDPTDRIADVVAAELDERGGGPRWLIASFRLATVERVRVVLPTARTAWLTQSFDQELVARTAAAGHDAIHPDVRTVDEATIRAAHAAGLAVNAWTCNERARMRELIAWGIDGICTDVADVALAVRRELLG